MRQRTLGSTPSRLLALGAGVLVTLAWASPAFAQTKNSPRPLSPEERNAARNNRQEGSDLQDRLRQLRLEIRQATMRQQAGDPSMDEEIQRLQNEMQELIRQQGEQQWQGAFGEATNRSRADADPNAQGGMVAFGVQGENGANRGELVGAEGEITLDFPGGALPLDEFIKWVQNTLDINIIAREEIRGQEVLFFAPLVIDADELLPLLSALLEKEGYALVRNELGWYDIVQAINLPPVFDNKLITTQVIHTPLISPTRLQQVINEALGQTQNQVRISAIEDLSILLVTGTPNRVTSVSEIVERYLEEREKLELFSYQFNEVSADYGRSRMIALNNRLAQSTGGQTGQAGAASAGGGGSNLAQTLVLDQGNKLIFHGRPDEWEYVRALAERVDTISALTPKRHVVGAELAEQIANAGRDLGLGPVRQGGGSSLFSGGIGSTNRNFGGQNQGADEAALASGFVLDANGGAFTYFGTPAQHERVDKLVRQYREQSENTRATVEIYKLHHMRAEDMANLLDGILEDPSQQNQFSGSPFIPGQRNRIQPTPEVIVEPLPEGEDPGAATGGEGDGFITATSDTVNIQFDESNNLIVVRATPRNQTEIERIIERLDQRLPQVLIEAQIVSVTVNEDFSWTADVDLSIGQFEFLSTFGVTSPGASLTDPVTFPGDNVGPGLNTGLFRSDFVPFAIQALETVGDTKLVSNPRILVNDNAEAEVVSNEVRPFSSTTQGTATTVTSQGGTADAGTQLAVTPRISAGGYLVLEYQIELSAFIGQGQGGLQPPQQTENYSSEVTIPSDWTVIVGGFVSTTDSEDESKIPLLGDIPILGNLFKSYTTQKVKRMIFVFITPRILDDPNFRDLRLATEGPLKDVQLDGIVPELQPAVIPITGALSASARVAPSSVTRSDLLLGLEEDKERPDEEPGE